jgi:hypothetical protein
VFGRLFAWVVEQAKDKGLPKGRWAVIDGTSSPWAAKGGRRFLKILEKHDAAVAKELSPLGEPEQDSEYADHDTRVRQSIGNAGPLL